MGGEFRHQQLADERSSLHGSGRCAQWQGPVRQVNLQQQTLQAALTSSHLSTECWNSRSTRSNSGHMSTHVPTRVVAAASVVRRFGSGMVPSLIARARSRSRACLAYIRERERGVERSRKSGRACVHARLFVCILAALLAAEARCSVSVRDMVGAVHGRPTSCSPRSQGRSVHDVRIQVGSIQFPNRRTQFALYLPRRCSSYISVRYTSHSWISSIPPNDLSDITID